ncbi:MAG: hypothetical protein Fur0018_04990 [Anaerolineales bacterium]
MNHKRVSQFWTALLVAILLLTGLFQSGAARIPGGDQTGSGALTPIVRDAIRHDTSAPLRVLATNAPAAPQVAESKPLFERRILPKTLQSVPQQNLSPDPVVQRGPVQGQSPATEFNFEGINNVNGVLPPDTNGDIGPNHYMQWVNLSLAVWSLDRNTNTATLVLGPVAGNSIWSGFGGACQTTNDGDPIVLYDHLADRWIISQFALPNFPSGPYYQCIAVSATGDPTGAWHRYAFVASNTKMNDYPHLGVWPDGYYMTVNQFTNGSSWGGAGVFAFERDKMLSGQTARMVYFDLYSVNTGFGGMLPSDLDGSAPATGTPNYFAEVDDSSWMGDSTDTMRIWAFHVDWNNTGNSTFGINGQPNYLIPVDNFNPIGFSIPQPNTSQGLDNLGDRLMHRLQFRDFGSYFTLVTNHTVDAGARAGVRWYELHMPSGGAWSMYQQGTYAGDSADGLHRWMGSAALDSAGNLAIGYSVSSSSVYPSIRYTGRLVNDPLGTLSQGEGEIIAGSGSQTHSAGRWGDYSMLGVDPDNGCTFWFTTEYIQSTGSAPWQTRIGSFTFPSCLSGLTGGMSGQVTNANTGAPVGGAQVSTDGYTAYTTANGRYIFESLPVGMYTVTVSAYGYYTQTIPNVEVFYNQSTSQDFSLLPRSPISLTGTVRDGSGQNWPLYARIDLSAPGYADTIFTDPQSGAYSLTLQSGLTYTLQVQAVSPGYTAQSAQFRSVLPVNTRNFTLTVDTTCAAPGYTGSGTCTPQSGGLLLGNVYDANTAAPINGVNLTNAGSTATSQATPDDSTLDDGFYTLFVSGSGAQPVSASATGYPAITETVNITPGGAAWHDILLPAGKLAYAPASVDATLIPTPTLTTTLVLSNTGSYTLTFSTNAVNAPLQALPDGPFAPATRRASPKHMTDFDAHAVYQFDAPQVDALPAGTLLAQWESGASRLWGLGFDPQSGLLWTGDAAARRVTAFSQDGHPAGRAFDAASLNGVFPAGMTYDPFGRIFWLLNVGGDDCLHAFSPLDGFSGQKVCPNTDNALHGVAFNPLDGTFFAGSWNDSIVYQFDSAGNILRSASTGLNIADLAFNPATGHLFVSNNAATGFDVYVLDANADFVILGGFDVPGLGDLAQAGLALDCEGGLWLSDQSTGTVRKAASGETGVCAWQVVPWLSVSPAGGTLAPGAAQFLTLTFDAAGLSAGVHQAHLKVSTGGAGGSNASIPISLTVNPAYGVTATLRTAPQQANAGEVVQYTVAVTNTGNAPDLYDITIHGAAWSTSAPSIIGYLNSGATGTFTVFVTVPAGLPGQSDQAQVTVTSRQDSAHSATVTITTTATGYSVFLPVLIR